MRRFLVVDDSATVRLMLKSAILRSVTGAAEVIEAENATVAETKFVDAQPEAVFLDMVLGTGPGGGAVLDRILARAPETRVILVTGLAPGDPAVVAAISAGAFGLLHKPVRAEAVREILDTLAEETGSSGRIR